MGDTAMHGAWTIKDIFEVEPSSWGLRGDPYLWAEMKANLGDLPIPNTEQDLITLLESTFEQLTGIPISSAEDVFIERFSHGGMSSGYVCLEFWRERAIPYLLTKAASGEKA